MKTNERTNILMPAGIPKWIRCYDLGEQQNDRYTVVFTKKRTASIRDGGQFSYVSMNASPYHPLGIACHGAHSHPIDRPAYSHLGKPTEFDDLPTDCRKLVVSDYCELWDIKNPPLRFHAHMHSFRNNSNGNPTAHWELHDDFNIFHTGSISRRAECGYDSRRDDAPYCKLLKMYPGRNITHKLIEGHRSEDHMYVNFVVEA